MFLFLFFFSWNDSLILWSADFYHYCLHLAPNGHWKEGYQAIVCGRNLPPSQFKQTLQSTGLIHIMVVSGAHLVLLHRFFSHKLIKWKMGALFTLSLLIFYCFVCKLEPPVIRAFFSLALFLLNHSAKLFWSPLQTTHKAGLLSLLFFPEWFFSKSFLLSWMAAMALQISKNPLTGSLFCFILLYPILMEFSPLSPWTIFINASLAPVIGSGLFPLSLLCFVFPLSPWVDSLWNLIHELLSLLKNSIPETSNQQTIKLPLTTHWLLLLTTYRFLLSLEKSDRSICHSSTLP